MDILNLALRKSIIQEIESDDNKRRKAEHQKRADVFNENQRPYVMKMLQQEFTAETVGEMRTCTSINLSPRIISEMASIYKNEPMRVFTECTEEQELSIKKIYKSAKANVKLKKANQKYKLHDQCTIQVLPNQGEIGIKLLAPHQYDVVPMDNDPEKAFAYVISAFDRSVLDNQSVAVGDIQGSYYGSQNQNPDTGENKKIADQNDYKIPKKYVFWTAEHNISCRADGSIIEQYPNPIMRLPFIDVSMEKDFEFWIRKGSGTVDFSLDFSVVLSDTCNTNRLQSYAQAVVTAEKIPEDLQVGPNRILFLPLDPTRPEAKPSFEFATPQPDMKASLDLQDRLVSYFLTSRGIDPKTIASSGEGNKYSSGLERLLAMIEKFEASQDDLDLFTCVEGEMYELLRSWYTVTVGTPALNPDYAFGTWPENSKILITFSKPAMVQTETDKEDSVIKRLDAGLITKVEAVMELRGVDKEKAEEIVEELDAPITLPADPKKFDQNNQARA